MGLVHLRLILPIVSRLQERKSQVLMKLISSDRNNSTETNEVKLWEIRFTYILPVPQSICSVLPACFYGLNHFVMVVHALKEIQNK